jgi:catechol 2,3-dioxygenase-like lactoylglutathione lyase family enzyme
MSVAPQEVITSKGEAVGRLTGLSHIVFVCRDMDATVRFYRDILGLKVITTSGQKAQQLRDAIDAKLYGTKYKREFTRQYFFELPNGEAFGFYEVPDSPDGRETPPLGHWLWPGSGETPPKRPTKLDHLSFDVASKEDIDWFIDHLTKNGIEIFGPVMPKEGSPTPFMYRIYFYDPSGNALEIATPFVDENGQPFDGNIYLLDTEPVPALLEED